MKTGYVYIVALNGRFGRVMRLGTSLRNPAERLARLTRAGGRRRAPRLVGYEFVEDMAGARAEIRAMLRPAFIAGSARTFRCGGARAREALKRAASRQETSRAARFHPQTGLLVDPDVELAGPVAQFSRSLAEILSGEAGPDLKKLDVFLHPYMVGTIATMFHDRQPLTKIPDAYLPEILRDIAWQLWKCRLKPRVFIRIVERTPREQRYLDLARYTLEQRKPDRAGTSARGFTRYSQLTAFMRAPEAHLSETMRFYAQTLNRTPAVKRRAFFFRILQLILLVAAIFALDAVIDGVEPGRWPSALLVLFFAGAAALTFNLYDKPDLTRGLGILTSREVEDELKQIENRGIGPA